ncbi:MAG: hypothetical protein BGO41_09815 [Clostridiales bacterium 38-18]|nr:MAG: hypothetical protein BGO41_09815 [Clostridiales bacterium 38-18]
MTEYEAKENQEESICEEAIEDYDDLRSAKLNDQSMNNYANKAHNMTIINHAIFNSPTDLHALNAQKIDTQVSKRYDLTTENDCIEFIEKHQKEEVFYVSVIMSLFDRTSLAEIPNLVHKLKEALLRTNNYTNQSSELENTGFTHHRAIATVLAGIEGEIYISGDGEKFIGFKEDKVRLFEVIWGQFPSLRQGIIGWLVELSTVTINNQYNLYQICSALKKIILEDRTNAKNTIFPLLYTHKISFWALGATAYVIYNESQYRDYIASICVEWQKTEFWSAFLIFISYLENEMIEATLQTSLYSILKNKLLSGNHDDLALIAVLSSQSTHIKLAILNILNTQFEQNKVSREKIAVLYLKLVRHAYFFVSKEEMCLSLIVLESEKQLRLLENILKHIMSEYDFRKRLFSILKAYMTELSSFDGSAVYIEKLTLLFYVLGCTPWYMEEIMWFLNQNQNDFTHKVIQTIQSLS